MSGRYQIKKKIGQGGVGAVYEAFDSQLQRKVALKRVLTPGEASDAEVATAADNLIREATTLSSLNHPNIVTVYDVGRDEEGGFVVMELLKGDTLDDVIAKSLLTLEDFEEVVNQTLEGLIAAQAVNMMHRDLKPGNVMLSWRPSGKFHVKILDFGLAKVSLGPAEQTLDQGDAILGSIYFMAPEQFERQPLTFATDMYAMGAIYYFTLAGKYPFTGDTPPQVMAAHLQHSVPNLKDIRPDLPEAVCQWVMWLINRDPLARPQSAREALDHFPDTTQTATFVTPIPAAAAEVQAEIRTVPSLATPQPHVPATGGPATQSRIPPTGSGRQPALSRTTGHTPTRATGRTTTSHPTSTGRVTGRVPAGPPAKGGGKLPIIIVSALSATALIIGGLVMVGNQQNSVKQRERLEQLDTENPKGTAEDVKLLTRFLSDDPRKFDPRALQILTDIEGPGVEDAIVEQLAKADPGKVRLALIQVVANRRIIYAFDEILAIFKTATGTERSASAETLKRISSPGEEKQLLTLLKGSLKDKDRSMLETAITQLLWGDSNVDSRSRFLLDELNDATGEYRKSLARILGTLGGTNTLNRITRIFHEGGSEDATSKFDALLALNSWPDRSAIGLLEELMATDDPSLKTAAGRAYIRMIGLPSQSSNDTKLWTKAIETAQRNDIAKLFGAMIDRPTTSTIQFLKTTEVGGFGPIFEKLVTEAEKTAAAAIPVVSGELIPASRAKLRGEGDGTYDHLEGYTVWKSPRTWLLWTLKFPGPGTYHVEVHASCPEDSGTRFNVYCAGNRFRGVVTETKAADDFQPMKFNPSPAVLEITANKAGAQPFFLAGSQVLAGEQIMNVRGIKLIAR